MDRPNCKCHSEPMQKNGDKWRCTIRRNAWKRLRWANYDWQYKEDARIRYRATLYQRRRLNELHS